MSDLNQTRDFTQKPGPRYIGRYKIEKSIGKGGFGEVYLAVDTQLQRFVAIKVPHKDRLKKGYDVEKHLAEARTIAKLDHENIIPIYDVGSTKEHPLYIVTKFIEGNTLDYFIKNHKLDLKKTLTITSSIAKALAYAHKNNIVHRDIKPGNIILDKSEKPFIADFGLALSQDEFGKNNAFAGTPTYMSPEQARGEGDRLDGRSDIFSLGVVLYELLIGKRPYQARNLDDLIEEIQNKEPKPPRQINGSIPKEIDKICLKCLSKRPIDRYSSGKDLADEIENYLNASVTTKEQPQGSPESSQTTARIIKDQSKTTNQRATVSRSTFLFADFKGFTDRIRIIEKTAGHHAAAEMKRKVAKYIDDALELVSEKVKPEDYRLIDTAGDGFFYFFSSAESAFLFSKALHGLTTEHNSHLPDKIAEHLFRIGIATGDAAWDEGKPVGHVVNIGARMQAASSGGELVIDPTTYNDLPDPLKSYFGPKEITLDKNNMEVPLFRTNFSIPTESTVKILVNSKNIKNKAYQKQITQEIQTNVNNPNKKTSKLNSRFYILIPILLFSILTPFYYIFFVNTNSISYLAENPKDLTPKEELVIEPEENFDPSLDQGDQNPSSDPESNYIPLFNKNDLQGWFVQRNIGKSVTWKNENGTLIGNHQTDIPDSNGSLASAATDFGDFHLKFQVKVLGRSCFLSLRDQNSKAGEKGPGYAIQLAGPVPLVVRNKFNGNSGSICKMSQTGDIDSVLKAAKENPWKMSNWNDVEIIALGNQIRVFINQIEVMDFTDESKLFSSGRFSIICRARSRIFINNMEIKKIEPKAVSKTTTPNQDRMAVVNKGKWIIENDILKQSHPGKGPAGILFGDPNWVNYVFTADIRSVSSAAQVSYRAQNFGNKSCVFFSKKTNALGNNFMNIESEGKTGHKIEVADHPIGFSITPSEWNTIKIVVRGNQATIFLNGKEAGIDKGLRHPFGRVGFRTFNGIAEFKNISVTGLGDKVLWEGLPDLP